MQTPHCPFRAVGNIFLKHEYNRMLFHFSILLEFSYFYDIITLYKPNIRERKMQDGIS